MQHGNVYPPEQAKQALEGFFRAENLAALRDLALRRTTQEVDDQLEEYMREAEHKTDLAERVAVLVDERPGSRSLLRHAWRLAQALDAELIVVYFRPTDSGAETQSLAQVLELAEDLNGRTIELTGLVTPAGVASLLEAEHANHIVLGHEQLKTIAGFVRVPFASRLLDLAPQVTAHIAPQR